MFEIIFTALLLSWIIFSTILWRKSKPGTNRKWLVVSLVYFMVIFNAAAWLKGLEVGGIIFVFLGTLIMAVFGYKATKFCPQCGAVINKNYLFPDKVCPSCGYKLN